jgi:pyrimidine-specific ribonucleoside hydrolase
MTAGRVSVLRCGALAAALALAAAMSGCGDDATSTTTVPPTTAATTTTAQSTTATAPPAAGSPLVIDTDLALDSVMAVLYLLGRPEFDVRAITVSGTGEVHCDPGVGIAAGLAALAGHPDIPVACGPEEPLAGGNTFPISWRQAADDAWGMQLPGGAPPSALAAPELLVSVISASPEPVAVFTDGPLTNLAAALSLDPGIAGNVAMAFVMGGAVDAPGNTPRNPDAEYNLWVDPVAAAEALASGMPITLVPLDATRQVPLQTLHLRVLREHQATPVAAAVVEMLEANAGFLASGESFFWDQLAAALLVDESLAGFETMRLAVVTDGERDVVGRTVRSPEGTEVRVAVTVDVERFEREFLSALAGEDVGPVLEPPKTPAASVVELVDALFAAAGAGDAAAWRGLCTDDALQSVYLVNAGIGRLMDSYPMADWDPGADPLEGMEILGDPLVSGDAAAVPVRFNASRVGAGPVEGFLVIVGGRAAEGMLVAGSASFFAEVGAASDPAMVRDLMGAQATAWNADDVDGVLATMTDDAAFWGTVIYPDTVDSGPALRDLLVGAFSLAVEVTGPPVVSGPFAVVPLRFADEISEEAFDGLGILWVRDGEIALQAIAMGERSGY